MNGNRLKKIVENTVALLLSGIRRAYAFLRKNAPTEAGLVSMFLILFAVSALFLDTKISRDLDPDTGKNWWTLSFETRDPDSLEFTIDNHSESTEFSYKVTRDKVVQGEGAASVEKGEQKVTTPSGNGDTTERTIITVESKDGSKKSIYHERS